MGKKREQRPNERESKSDHAGIFHIAYPWHEGEYNRGVCNCDHSTLNLPHCRRELF